LFVERAATGKDRATMITRHRIAPNGPEFSRLAYGTWRILDEEDKANCSPRRF
jgi:hypothetical protein